MSNPTGSTYLQANAGYVWSDGDTYEIPQADQQEGAAVGASFGGLGVDNQPHQILLNKIQYTHGKQLTDESNIAALQVFRALFASKVGINGYLKLGAQDVNLGQIDIILQWGSISLIGLTGAALKNQPFSFNWPLSGGFPHACWRLMPWWETNTDVAVDPEGPFAAGMMVVEAVTPYSAAGPNQIFSDWDNSAKIRIAQSPNDGAGLTGIGWVAIGY
jgi:hypothetical protein